MTQIRIPVEVLPTPNKNGDQILQFRVISEDRNYTSPWSNLYVVKSIGQYRPLESSYVYTSSSANKLVSVTWDTPTIYNYSASLTSASIAHNHTQNYKQHDTDIYIKWNPSSSASYYEYHDRVGSDSTTIVVPAGATSVRIIGGVAAHNIPFQGTKETTAAYRARLDSHVNNVVLNLFKIFDTGNQTIT